MDDLELNELKKTNFKVFIHGGVVPFREDYPDLLTEWMSEGKGIEAFCANLGFSKNTFYKMCRDNPALAKAFEAGKDARLSKDLRLMEELADGSREKGNVTAIIYKLKVIHGLNETSHVVNHDANIDLSSDVDLSKLSQEELEALEALTNKAKKAKGE